MSGYIEHESMENYMETIYKLAANKEVVRSIDIAKNLNLSRPSVSRAVKLLREKGLINVSEGGQITMTDEGRRVAERVNSIHRNLVNFLCSVISISPECADVDACRIEHVISQVTVDAIEKYNREHDIADITCVKINSHFPVNSELLESGENYLENIYLIKKKRNGIRAVDVAKVLEVSRPSVSRALNILKQKGFVEVDERNEINLTATGEQRAREIFHKHQNLEKFLTAVLNIDSVTADRDACRIEHMISDEAFSGILLYLRERGIEME